MTSSKLTSSDSLANSPQDDGIPPFRYTAVLADQIETTWQDRWELQGTFNAPNPSGPLADGFDKVADRAHAFVLDMFPYPSGAGLHVGHPLGFIGTDVFARYLRMNGTNVLHTMGFDAFGLPAEQYAVQTGQHPGTTTNANIDVFTRQLKRMGLGHDKRRVIATTDANYYRWTQWIFLQIFNSFYDTELDRARPIKELIAEFENGTRTSEMGAWVSLSPVRRHELIDSYRLAYRTESMVNWCPGLGTVLANEEVTADNRSERGNFPVFRKPLAQWMMRITSYADRLVRDLDGIDWPDKVRTMQRNWIGRSRGAHVTFTPVADAGDIEVFTTRPDTLFGATYLVLAPEHDLVGVLTASQWPADIPAAWTNGAPTPADAVADYQKQAAAKSEFDRRAESKTKSGVFTGSYAINPINGQKLPVFIADYVLTGYGTGAIMAVPAHDQRDWEFATMFSLPIVQTVDAGDGGASLAEAAYVGDGKILNSANDRGLDINGMDVETAKNVTIEWLQADGSGRGAVTYRLRDWLFSRQRYWGEPFPIVYDETGLPIALPESMLPLELPDTHDFSPAAFDPEDVDSDPAPPLGRLTDWVTVTLDLGDGPKQYRRETNTMPNWAGSCWYELRYLDPTNDAALVDPEVERYWMGPDAKRPMGGVDLYVGGVEHAVLHLLYARFWHKVLFDLGHVSSAEPFHRLVNQGYVEAYAYTDERGMYVEASKVVEKDGAFFYEDQPVERQYGKMGKSLKNVTTPDEMYAAYGADTLRLFEMFTGPLEQSRPWDTKAVVGSFRLLQRIWRLAVDEVSGELRVSDGVLSEDVNRTMHKTIAAVREGYEQLRFNTSIARITELTNTLTQAYPDGGTPRVVIEPLVLMLAPLAPHLAEELWSRLGHSESLAWSDFPVADESLLVDDTVSIPVQVNGKVRVVIDVATGLDAATLEATVRADERVVALLDGAAAAEGKEIRRVIVVPGRMVNFVL